MPPKSSQNAKPQSAQKSLLNFFQKNAPSSSPSNYKSGPPKHSSPLRVSQALNIPAPLVSSQNAPSSDQIDLTDSPVIGTTLDVIQPLEYDSEDEGAPVGSKRKFSKKAVIQCSDDEEIPSKKTKTTRASNPELNDDVMEDFFADIANDSFEDSSSPRQIKTSPVVLKSTSGTPAPKIKPTQAKPTPTTRHIERQSPVESKKEASKKANEQIFSFLVDPKDADGNRPGEEGYDPRTLYIPKSAWNEFTPFEAQFWEIKSKHYDTVLFFQKGKFFELYEEDASIGHREFDLKMTDRVKMRMVGVPEMSFDFWASKFLARGYKVGKVEQSETSLGAELRVKDGKAKGKAPTGKSIVRRELKSVLTTGTLVDGTMLTDDLSSHCVAIKEYTPSQASLPAFGVCTLDASTAEFSLSHFEDDISRTQLETLIRQIRPKELIHEKGNLSVSTLRLLRNVLSLECQWTALKPDVEFFTPEQTRQELLTLFTPKQLDAEGDEIQVEEDEERKEARVPENIKSMYDKEPAMAALGGMIWYLRQLNLDGDLVTARNFNVYDVLAKGNALILDGQTLAHIEVLQNSQGGIEGTIYQLLSRCITPFGKRLFKVWLCAPLKEADAINERLDSVQDLMKTESFVSRFDSMVKKLPDLERMLSRIHAKSVKKQDFLKVLESFKKITLGFSALAEEAEKGFESEGVKRLLRRAPDIKPLLQHIDELYEGDELLPVDGKDEAFEVVRSKVDGIENELEEYKEKMKKQLKTLDVEYKDIGTKDIYQLQVPIKIKVPANWTKMSGTKQFNRYWSPEITKLVSALKEARERKTAVVNDFQYRLYGEFDKDYSVWMDVVRIVAELDCLVGLCKSSLALGEPAVRPEIVESDAAFVEFEDLRHPCVINSSSEFIPNDVFLGGDTERMILLTGPNMAGKSTLLRMTCAAVIMAQIGCFVPASKARISPVDAIYSRMGANDFIFSNASTFKVEMDDCNKILSKSTPKSLVILDELGRGTSTYDGMAIAYSVLHRLSTHVGCIGFFATHFTNLTEDFTYHPMVRLCNMQTQMDEETRVVVFLYKLVLGSAPKSYGPHVASMAGLSEILVKRAIDVSQQFETSSKAREQAVRANERLPLAIQADAAFLVQFARLGLGGMKQQKQQQFDRRQLLRTLQVIKKVALDTNK